MDCSVAAHGGEQRRPAVRPEIVEESVSTAVRHIIWDWNGTLFDDFWLVVETTDATMRELGLPGMTATRYRELYCRPLRTFYSRAAGRELSEEEWLRLDEAFHDRYHARMRQCSLAAHALELLTSWPLGGRSQSLLSMWAHPNLTAYVAELGIAERFARVDGRTDPPGAAKTPALRRHLAALGESSLRIEPGEVVMIGDSLDDAEAAAAAGVACVLVSSGVHHPAALEATGFPVVTTLAQAVALVATPGSEHVG